MALPLYWSDRRKLAAEQVGVQAMLAEERSRQAFVEDRFAQQNRTGAYAPRYLEFGIEWQDQRDTPHALAEQRMRHQKELFDYQYTARQQHELNRINNDLAAVQESYANGQLREGEYQWAVNQLQAKRYGIEPLPIPKPPQPDMDKEYEERLRWKPDPNTGQQLPWVMDDTGQWQIARGYQPPEAGGGRAEVFKLFAEHQKLRNEVYKTRLDYVKQLMDAWSANIDMATGQPKGPAPDAAALMRQAEQIFPEPPPLETMLPSPGGAAGGAAGASAPGQPAAPSSLGPQAAPQAEVSTLVPGMPDGEALLHIDRQIEAIIGKYKDYRQMSSEDQYWLEALRLARKELVNAPAQAAAPSQPASPQPALPRW